MVSTNGIGQAVKWLPTGLESLLGDPIGAAGTDPRRYLPWKVDRSPQTWMHACAHAIPGMQSEAAAQVASLVDQNCAV